MPEILLYIAASIVLTILLALILPSKGKIGEKRVASKLDRLPKAEYRVLNDVMLQTPKGTSQIDHLVVSIYGIFVIETKFYKGLIFGYENSQMWTQNIFGNKNEFYNPVLQNGGHVKALAIALKELGFTDLPFFPIVAFSGQADLRVKTEGSCVIYWNQILTTIRRYSKPRLSMDQVDKICRLIDAIRLDTKDRKVKREHLQDIKAAKQRKSDAIHSGRCPQCGGRLILRTGNHGQFYGCSNYPRCRFTCNPNC